MLIFGHVGITVGLAFITEKAIKKIKGEEYNLKINYIMVAAGSMLPDIIDKPLGHAVLRESLNNGRIISHTLAFAALLWLIAVFYLYRGKTGPLALVFGSLAHLVLDRMWLKPEILFWPVYGWSFPYSDKDFLQNIIKNLDKPQVYVPEVLGAVILILFLIDRIRHKRSKKIKALGVKQLF